MSYETQVMHSTTLPSPRTVFERERLLRSSQTVQEFWDTGIWDFTRMPVDVANAWHGGSTAPPSLMTDVGHQSRPCFHQPETHPHVSSHAVSYAASVSHFRYSLNKHHWVLPMCQALCQGGTPQVKVTETDMDRALMGLRLTTDLTPAVTVICQIYFVVWLKWK